MSLFDNAMHSFDYDGMEKLKWWNAKAKMLKKRLLLKAQRDFRPVKTSFSNGGFLDEIAWKDNPQKMSLLNEKDRSSAHEVEIILVDGMEVASSRNKRARKQRCITCTMFVTETRRSRRIVSTRKMIAREAQQSLLQPQMW